MSIYTYDDPDGGHLLIEPYSSAGFGPVVELRRKSAGRTDPDPATWVKSADAGTVAAEILKAAGVVQTSAGTVGRTRGPLSVYHQDALGNRTVYAPDHARQVALSLLLAADEAERPTYDADDLSAVVEAAEGHNVTLYKDATESILHALESRGWKKEAA